MIKFLVSFLFSFIFLANLTLPTLKYTFDFDIEKSLLINISEEEEEEKGSEKQKELEILLNKEVSEHFAFEEPTKQSFKAYFNKPYQKPQINQVFSPPDLTFSI
jgi:hypothetical protein